MTPCEKLGYKVGDRFEVVDDDYEFFCPVGTIVVLHYDDGTNCPQFRNESRSEEECFIRLASVRPLPKPLKSGDEITQDGKKYRVPLEEIHEFKPGMMCLVDWSKADASCVVRTKSNRVVYIGYDSIVRSIIAYADTSGSITLGYVNTSSLRPE